MFVEFDERLTRIWSQRWEIFDLAVLDDEAIFLGGGMKEQW